MVLQESNTRRFFSGAENMPPIHLSAKLLSFHTSTPNRRRRNRIASNAAPYTIKSSIERTKLRKQKVAKAQKSSVRFNVSTTRKATSEAQPVAESSKGPAQTIPVQFPRVLSRPVFKDINREHIRSIDADLANADISYIQSSLEEMGPLLFHSLAAIKAAPARDRLPPTMSVQVVAPTHVLPSHMLAIFGKTLPSGVRQVTLYPTHSLVLSAHCANLPKFPPPLSLPPNPNTFPYDLTLPVFSIQLPAPANYPALSTYLYTKRVDILFKQMFPIDPPTALDENVVPFAKSLAETITVPALIKHALNVHGMWQNACALGIHDEGLWFAIDVMWDVYMMAIAFALGQPEVMLDEEEMKKYAASS